MHMHADKHRYGGNGPQFTSDPLPAAINTARHTGVTHSTLSELTLLQGDCYSCTSTMRPPSRQTSSARWISAVIGLIDELAASTTLCSPDVAATLNEHCICWGANLSSEHGKAAYRVTVRNIVPFVTEQLAVVPNYRCSTAWTACRSTSSRACCSSVRRARSSSFGSTKVMKSRLSPCI